MKVVLVLAALLLCAVSVVTAQNLNFTNCIASGGHVFQWAFYKGTDNQDWIRARLIYKGGYGGWGAIGFRYGRDYLLPYDQENGMPQGKMGSDVNQTHIFMAYRDPNTDAHYWREMAASSNGPPTAITPTTIVNPIIRSTVKGDIHFYFERKAVVSIARRFDFIASRTDADVLLAGSTMSAITATENFDDNKKHNYAKLWQKNIMSSGSDGSCNGLNILATMPAARAIVQPTTNEPQTPTGEASTSRMAFVIYLLGCALLAILIGKF